MCGEELKKKLDGIGISYAELARQLGVFPQSFNKTLKAKDVGSGVLENIAKIIGKDMNFFYEVPVHAKDDLEQLPARRSYDERVGVPYFNISFEMGFDLMLNDQTVNPEYMIDCQPYNKCDVWCNARGDSMLPTISSGDVIALKEVRDPKSCLINNEIYAIVTTNNLRTIKRVNDNGETITLVPDNKECPEQTINKELLLKVYRVIGCLKMF